jgi:hypothetical protein
MLDAPDGNAVVVIATGTWVTAMLRVAVPVAAGVAESVAVTWKLIVPGAVGLPEITPAEVIVSPAGSAPIVTAKVYGAVPPTAVNVVEA